MTTTTGADAERLARDSLKTLMAAKGTTPTQLARRMQRNECVIDRMLSDDGTMSLAEFAEAAFHMGAEIEVELRPVAEP